MVDQVTAPADTVLPAEPPAHWVRRARNWRRAGVVLLSLVVLAGATGWLGVKTGEVAATGGEYRLTVTYPQVTRAGLAVPWHVRIVRDGGFDGPVTLAVSDAWFDLFDFQSFFPAPSAETGGGEFVYYEFDPPPGEVFELSLDARTAPDQNVGAASAEVTVLEGDRPIVSVEYRTWVVP